MKRNNSMKFIIATVLFLIIVGIMVMVYLGSKPKPADETNKGTKQDTTVTTETDTKDDGDATVPEDSAGAAATSSDATATEQVVEKKSITVQVAIPDEETKEYVISTDADFLRQALDQEKLIEGKDSGFGFFITGVNGRIADDSKQEWWCITKGGEQVNYGVDQIVLEDGDQYEITLTVGF